MQNIIIGTAGHVDHGKTQLIKALSGIDTDRLDEEKKRGITIELGFAHIPNDAGYNIGVIDVPGHEKFIKNMLAGIGGIDFVVFVVAADEGIMPQTREHFEILESLGIEDGIIAVTKTDMVEKDWLDMLIEEVKDYFKSSFLEGKPIIPVSSRTGDNIEVLKEEIIKKCDRKNKRREEKELFRLPIDRVFSMSGFGTVVTGTLLDGSISVGDEVMIEPKGIKAKVRGIQTYGKETDSAIAGQRTAINLANVKKEEIARGDVLAAENAVVNTSMIDVKLKVFKSSDRQILNNSRVHIYAGAKETLCKVVLLERGALAAGEEALAQLRLEEPMALRRADRFIIRFYSPIITIGGGEIIDVNPDKHKRNKPEIIESLKALEGNDLPKILEMKTGQYRFLNSEDLAHEIGMLPGELASILDSEIQAGNIIRLEDKSLLSKNKFERLKTNLENLINKYHDANPLVDGIPKQELLSKLSESWHIEDEKLLQALVNYLLQNKVIIDKGKTIALTGFAVEFSPEQLKIKDGLQSDYEAAGIEFIESNELYKKYGDKEAAIAMQQELVQEGIIIRVDPAHYASVTAWNKCIEAAREFPAEFTLAEYRDKLQTSRKFAEVILAALDKQGITYFNNVTRVVISR